MTIILRVTDDTLKELKQIRFSDLRPLIQKKAEAVILHAHGLPTEEIADILDCSNSTICSYLNEFDRRGLDGLLEVKESTRKGALEEYRDLIGEDFLRKPPATSNEAVRRIEELTGLKRGKTQVKEFLKKSLGMAYRKTAVVPAKADIDAQEEFKKKLWSLQ